MKRILPSKEKNKTIRIIDASGVSESCQPYYNDIAERDDYVDKSHYLYKDCDCLHVIGRPIIVYRKTSFECYPFDFHMGKYLEFLLFEQGKRIKIVYGFW